MKILVLSCSKGGGHNACGHYIEKEFKKETLLDFGIPVSSSFNKIENNLDLQCKVINRNSAKDLVDFVQKNLS